MMKAIFMRKTTELTCRGIRTNFVLSSYGKIQLNDRDKNSMRRTVSDIRERQCKERLHAAGLVKEDD